MNVCPKCGHEVGYKGALEGSVEHLPGGGHKYTPKLGAGRPKPTFK